MHRANCHPVALIAFAAVMNVGPLLIAQSVVNTKYAQPDKFRQLEEILPTPNDYRTASGAPGHRYWQQKADYDINVELDDEKQRIVGSEVITYQNNSPDSLRYVWLQLDANRFHPQSAANRSQTAPRLSPSMSFKDMDSLVLASRFPGGTKIRDCRDDKSNRVLRHTVVGSNMRIDLNDELSPGQSTSIRIAWEYNIPEVNRLRARGGCEHFPKDDNYIYEIAQWFPRMCVYSDVTGWQNKEFLGKGEFTLEFGDYVVRITVPEDHVVASTGVLLNPTEVLSEAQRKRLLDAKTSKKPVFVITPEEAMANQAEKAEGKRTWVFKATNVRDFAFASSRKFIWDAMGHDSDGNQVMAMSFYPNEAEPLWSRYSTHAIVHTLQVYSRYTFQYPYPTAISVNGPVGGMEYPMICFNGPRPEEDGTYTARTKYGLISVVIHEVGHNYFPMIVNSDERQWTWMDEGLNTFLQYLAEVEWEEDYPSRRGEPKDIVEYMRSTNQVPVMTNSESLLQFGPNAYSKPATALNILRETILGRELFDFAFREYAQRWKNKRPYPADFFRTMEDASGVDLDWFWRGWFYSTDHVDIGISNVRHYTINDGNPAKDSEFKRAERDAKPETMSQQRNEGIHKRTDDFPELKDFYNSFDDLEVTDAEKKKFDKYLKDLPEDERRLLGQKTNFYIVDLENIGGLVMPVILKLHYADGTTSEVRLPAEIWAQNCEETSKLIMSPKEIESIELDPHLETADTVLSNNVFPPRITKSRFKLYQQRKETNEMQKAGLGSKKEANAKGDDSEKKEKASE
ncbi:MAG: M1 family metallopeptidase [Planctomycetaceae bacterium]